MCNCYMLCPCFAKQTFLWTINGFVFYMFKRSIYPLHECVFTVCVGRSSEFNWRWTRPITWASSLTRLPPLSPPPYLSIQSADINTDLYSFTQCEFQHGQRREKGQKGQERTERIRLSWLLGCLLTFCFVTFAPESRGSLRQKGPFSKQ